MTRFLPLLMCFVLLGGELPPQQTSFPHPDTRAESSIIAAWTVDGEQASAEFGFAVAAGDVNGDGYEDVFVGIPKYGEEIARAGAVFGYYGGPGGLKSTPDWQMTGPQAGARFGGAVALEDVNGDGCEDVFVGAFRFNGGQAEEGAVFGFYGSADGLGNTADWVVEGEVVEGQFGYAVASAGDVNGDGFGEVLVGARGQNTFGGAAFVYLGTAGGLDTSHAWTAVNLQTGASLGFAVASAGDVNGDGFDEIIIGAPFFDLSEDVEDVGAVWLYEGSVTGLRAAADWFGMGTQAGEQLGGAVGGAGDVNGDGFDEVLVGARGWDGEVSDEGAVFLHLGSALGLGAEPAWTGTGGQTGSGYGAAVGGAGDLDHDGRGDVLVGAYLYMEDQPEEGAVFVYLGTGNGQLEAIACPVGDKAETWFGYAVSKAGDVDGDGDKEILVGAPEYRVSHDLVGRAYLYEMHLFTTYTLFLPAVWADPE